VCGSVGCETDRGVDRLREYLNVCVGVLGCETDRGVDRVREYLNVCVGVLGCESDRGCLDILREYLNDVIYRATLIMLFILIFIKI